MTASRTTSPAAAREAHDARTVRLLGQLERKVLWLSSWMIHNANHLRDSRDGLKVGGHQASSASLATLSWQFCRLVTPSTTPAPNSSASKSPIGR